MTGNSLNVYLGDTVIAHLLLEQDQISMQYTKDWQQSGFAISPPLPLSNDLPHINVQRYLRNLFPEGEILDTLLTRLQLNKANTFGIIKSLGIDTSGALLFMSPESNIPTTSSFRKITSQEIEERLENRDDHGLIFWDGKPRLSMAGIQDKINVTINSSGEMGFGDGTLSSTHILKFEKHHYLHLAINEYVTIKLAKSVGLQVPNVKLLRFGKHPALLIERFDRKLISNNKVLRRHVIDGCQALNLPPEYKYERNFGSNPDVAHIREGASLLKLFEMANRCINPAKTKSHMLDWVLFNLLTYNFDAHGKNISFFVGEHGMSLTPFYELVNINMYSQFNHELAMALGDDFEGKKITAFQLADFADACQISRLYLVRQLNNMTDAVLSALTQNNIRNIGRSEDEKMYLDKYQKMISTRCKDLIEISANVNDVIL